MLPTKYFKKGDLVLACETYKIVLENRGFLLNKAGVPDDSLILILSYPVNSSSTLLRKETNYDYCSPCWYESYDIKHGVFYKRMHFGYLDKLFN